MEGFRQVIEFVVAVVDGAGVLVLVLVTGIFLATARFAVGGAPGTEGRYRACRQNMGKAILLGLEFLVAADIIRTVIVSPTIDHVLALGLVVLIRTFLSLSLELELEATWPWKRARERIREHQSPR